MKKVQHHKESLSKKIIFNYNRLWRQLYYDYLYECDTYQISVCAADPNGYYNAIHGITKITPTLEQHICSIELKHAVQLGVFSFQQQLPGWIRRPSEDENWWEIKLSNTNFPKVESNKLQLDLFSFKHKEQLDIFLEIDKIANNLSDALVSTLRNNIIQRHDFKSCLVLGTYNNNPCGCGYLGIVDNIAYLAEGGVLPEFRKNGFHKIITQIRLNEAAKSASKAVMVCAANSDSNKTAKSLGFQKVATRYFFERQLSDRN